MVRLTYEGNHRKVPGSCQSCLGGASVLGADERDRALGVEPRHRAERLERVGLVVARPVVQPTVRRRRRVKQIAVGASQGVLDSADEVLAVAHAQRQQRQKADQIAAPRRRRRR